MPTALILLHTGASFPQSSDAYCPPYFHKIYKLSPLFSFDWRFIGFIYVFLLPLFWQWCIYASWNTRTGRPCLHRNARYRKRQRKTRPIQGCMIDVTIKNCAPPYYIYSLNKIIIDMSTYWKTQLSSSAVSSIIFSLPARTGIKQKSLI